MDRFWSLFRNISFSKTIRFNLKYFTIQQAIKIPIIVYKGVCVNSLHGSIEVHGKIKSGILKIGRPCLGNQDSKYDRTIFALDGLLTIQGNIVIGRGTKIAVTGHLQLGDGFEVTGDSSIICNDSISIGRRCLISWNCLIMDNDFHYICTFENEILNAKLTKPIIIGDNVWIGCNCTILKGVQISEGNIIASSSLITKSIDVQYSIVASKGGHVEVLAKNRYYKKDKFDKFKK